MNARFKHPAARSCGAPARPHETELLLCGHHYRVSRLALDAARASVRGLQGTPLDVAAWIDGAPSARPAALAGR